MLYIDAFNLNVDNIDKYTRDEIKNIYKKIALECHPDKLTNISDENERTIRIERFKKASIAYKKAIDDFDNYGKLNYRSTDYDYDNFSDDYEIYNNFDLNFWKNTYDSIFKDKEIIKNTFIDVASFFFNKGFKTKNYYNPSTKIIKHNINLPITYNDLCTLNKRKLRILLKNVKEPVYINICCKNEYPCLTRQYIDDDSIEHEITINMIIDNTYSNICDDNDNNYTHSISNYDNNIDLNIILDINILDYLIGGVKKIKYVDNTYIDINIKPFCLEDIIIKNKGLLGGNLNVKLLFKHITLKEWNKISKKKRNKFVDIINLIYKDLLD
jgi:DnaJ-class molecular chaperone